MTELLERLLPGLLRGETAWPALGLLAAAVGAFVLAAQRGEDPLALLLAGLGLAAWAQGTAWLVVGHRFRLDHALHELSSERWAVFLVVWAAPIGIVWTVVEQLRGP